MADEIRPDTPESAKRIFDRVTVQVRNGDHAVAASFSPHTGITVRLDPDRLSGYDDAGLAGQVETVLNRALAGGRQAGELAVARSVGEPRHADDDPVAVTLVDERRRRAHEMLAGSEFEGISPLTEVRVGFHVDAGFAVDIQRGAVRGNTVEALEAEINAAVISALKAYVVRLREVHDTVITRLSNRKLKEQLNVG